MQRFKPDFLTNEQFRSYLTGSAIDKLFSVGGLKATTFLKKQADCGRPITSFLAKSDSSQHPAIRKYKVSHILAVAKAHALEVTKPLPPKQILKEYELIGKLQHEVAQLQSRKDSLEKSISVMWPYKFNEHEVAGMLSGIDGDLPAVDHIISNAQQLNNVCGIYFLIKDGEIVYVGQSVSVMARIQSHTASKEFDSFSFLPCKREILNVIESLYIHLLEPSGNGKAGGSSFKKCAPLNKENLMKLLLVGS